YESQYVRVFAFASWLVGRPATGRRGLTSQGRSTKVPWKAGYEATSESGMIFRWYENNSTVISFFPKY
ncbi:hypothetical protein LV89_05012, partial [Arcicella aurantiaca]